MSNTLKFHIDSQRAYDVNKAKEYAERDAFGEYKYAKAYAQERRNDLGDDIVQNIKVEEIVSMQELISMATKTTQE